MKTIEQILVRRDNMKVEDAKQLICDACDDLHSRLSKGEDAYDICEEWFGLEPDYLMELVENIS